MLSLLKLRRFNRREPKMSLLGQLTCGGGIVGGNHCGTCFSDGLVRCCCSDCIRFDFPAGAGALIC